MSKIEQIIGEMEEYIDNCRYQPLSSSKIIVNKDEIDDFLDDLRQNLPDEIKKYQRIIANRDAILKDAQDKAEEMIKKANEMTSTLVSEHEIMQQAFREANIVIEDASQQATAIVEDATAEANNIKMSAIQYTDDSLAEIQEILNTAIEGLTVRCDGLMRSLESSLEIANKNRQSLREFQTATGNNGSASAAHQPAPVVPDEYPEPEKIDNSELIEEEYNEPDILEEENLIQDMYEPTEPANISNFSEISIEDALKETDNDLALYDDIPNISDYGSLDEIKDFDLAFDEID